MITKVSQRVGTLKRLKSPNNCVDIHLAKRKVEYAEILRERERS